MMKTMNDGRDQAQGDGGGDGLRWSMPLLLAIIALGFVCVVGLSRWMDEHRPPVDSIVEEERLYMTGAAIKRMSLGFNGLVADWYWMRSLQYVGRKALDHEGRFQLDDLGPLNLKLLAPLLDTATTLDPEFIAVYEYGAVVLPAINDEHAIALLKKGIAANPSAWRLYHHLGYIYWQRGDYQTASETYAAGAKLPAAPAWMEQMSARLLAEGGDRATAREMYERMRDEADDEQVKHLAELRLLQIRSFDERDVIRRALTDYAERKGRCAASWKEVGEALRAARLRLDAAGAPLDPANTPYVLDKGGCDVDLDPRSLVPYK
jgi:tetratricopeptide (TPR) repeat protein